MSLKLQIYDQLVFPNMDVASKEDAISFLAEQLIAKGIAVDGYTEALLEREAIYPTGLPSNNYSIAIPHADYTLVKETTVAIGILKNPVFFKAMDNIEKDISISIVIMLAINEPHGQIEMLQRIVGIIQNDDLRKTLVESEDKTEPINQLIYYLKGEQ